MNAPLLAGLFGAWTAVQLALGAFFLQAYFARRREIEYLLFGLVCFSLGVTDLGLTITTADLGWSHFAVASTIAHMGAMSATAFNVHFVVAYVAPVRGSKIAAAIYGLNAVY